MICESYVGCLLGTTPDCKSVNLAPIPKKSASSKPGLVVAILICPMFGAPKFCNSALSNTFTNSALADPGKFLKYVANSSTLLRFGAFAKG
jgi:hypothetical protein